MGLMSKRKGQAGEREFAAWLRQNLNCPEARRGCQNAGGPDSPDVTSGPPGIHFECKRVQALNLGAAMGQAILDAGDAVPVVAHRKNHEHWRLTIRADDLCEFCTRILAARNDPPTPEAAKNESFSSTDW